MRALGVNMNEDSVEYQSVHDQTLAATGRDGLDLANGTADEHVQLVSDTSKKSPMPKHG